MKPLRKFRSRKGTHDFTHCQLMLSEINENWNMSTHFRQNSASNFTKTFSAALYRSRTGRQMAKVIREILQTFAANAPKSLVIHCVRNTGYLFLLTYLFTPWSTVLLDTLPVAQLVKKFPAFYGTRRFITAFTSARHLSLF